MFGIPLEATLGIVSGLAGFAMKYMAQKRANQHELMKLAIKRSEAEIKVADAAAKRSSPFLRKVVALFVVLIAFGGLLIVAFFDDVDVSLILPRAQKSFLGIFKFGRTYDLVQVSGFLVPDYIRFSVVTIIGFLFGSGASKITSN